MDDKATISETLSSLGEGLKVLGQMEMKVVPGKEYGKFIVMLNYDKK